MSDKVHCAVKTPREPWVQHEGPIAFHDQRCAVLPGEHAVLDLNSGIFQPSWAAQMQGWQLVHANTWLRRLALRLFWGRRWQSE